MRRSGPGRGDPGSPQGFVWGLCAPWDPEGPSPTMARHNSNASALHEPSLEEKGKYPPGTQMGTSLPACWSRALFPGTFKV